MTQSESIPMTVNPSDERALRLPRDFALIAVGLDVAMFVISTVVLLTRFTPDVEQIRSAYAQPEVYTVALSDVDRKPLRFLLDGQGRQAGPYRVILQRRWCTEHRHDAVASKTADRAVIALNH